MCEWSTYRNTVAALCVVMVILFVILRRSGWHWPADTLMF